MSKRYFNYSWTEKLESTRQYKRESAFDRSRILSSNDNFTLIGPSTSIESNEMAKKKASPKKRTGCQQTPAKKKRKNNTAIILDKTVVLNNNSRKSGKIKKKKLSYKAKKRQSAALKIDPTILLNKSTPKNNKRKRGDSLEQCGKRLCVEVKPTQGSAKQQNKSKKNRNLRMKTALQKIRQPFCSTPIETNLGKKSYFHTETPIFSNYRDVSLRRSPRTATAPSTRKNNQSNEYNLRTKRDSNIQDNTTIIQESTIIQEKIFNSFINISDDSIRESDKQNTICFVDDVETEKEPGSSTLIQKTAQIPDISLNSHKSPGSPTLIQKPATSLNNNKSPDLSTLVQKTTQIPDLSLITVRSPNVINNMIEIDSTSGKDGPSPAPATSDIVTDPVFIDLVDDDTINLDAIESASNVQKLTAPEKLYEELSDDENVIIIEDSVQNTLTNTDASHPEDEVVIVLDETGPTEFNKQVIPKPLQAFMRVKSKKKRKRSRLGRSLRKTPTLNLVQLAGETSTGRNNNSKVHQVKQGTTGFDNRIQITPNADINIDFTSKAKENTKPSELVTRAIMLDNEQLSYSMAVSGSRNTNPANVASNIAPNTRQRLRPIIIDGSNVAIGHSNGKKFSCEGLKICIDYFVKRGHEVNAFVPQYRRQKYQSSNPNLLEKLASDGFVVFTPSRRVKGRLIVPYDDRYIVECASQKGGIIVSNDNYRDLLLENPQWKETIEKRLLMWTWCGDMIMFPIDPYGRSGPSLDELLRF